MFSQCSHTEARQRLADLHRTTVPARSGVRVDNGLALAPLDWVERGDGVVEGRDGSDVHVKMPVPHPVGNLRQLARNGLDDEVDREAVGWVLSVRYAARPDGRARESASRFA